MASNTLTKAYAALGDETPLIGDCGHLCGKACCKGIDGEITGMLLFPGESELLEDTKGFEIMESGLLLADVPIKLLVCGGNCDRVKRPLMCRFFPLIPYVSIAGNPNLRMNRFFGLCPLVRSGGKRQLKPAFLLAAKNAAKILLKDKLCIGMIHLLSRQADEMDDDPFYSLLS